MIDNKSISFGICIIFIVVIATLSCAVIDSMNHKTEEERCIFTEWISPDGTHYWYKSGAYGAGYLAPRYDNDGNLVIDK